MNHLASGSQSIFVTKNFKDFFHSLFLKIIKSFMRWFLVLILTITLYLDQSLHVMVSCYRIFLDVVIELTFLAPTDVNDRGHRFRSRSTVTNYPCASQYGTGSLIEWSSRKQGALPVLSQILMRRTTGKPKKIFFFLILLFSH